MRQTYRKAKRYRSMLFVPGHKIDWMLKAPQYGSDALIFDLEDAVPVAMKPSARERIAEALDELKDGPFARFVRLNGWRTDGRLLEDLMVVVRDGLDGVVLPKTEDVEDVAGLDLLLGELEALRSLPVGSIEIVPLRETTRAMYRVHEICLASERVKRVSGVGGSPVPGGDVTRELGTHPSDPESDVELYLTGGCVVAARAAGVTEILGGSTTIIGDTKHVRRMAERAKTLGATGSLCFHPTQVPILNDVFAPSAAEILEAQEILQVMAEGVSQGHAAIRYNDRFVDYAHVRASLELLDHARSVGIDVGDPTELQTTHEEIMEG
jgi:citrate lyase subunit beta/citryl-CoA lyase